MYDIVDDMLIVVFIISLIVWTYVLINIGEDSLDKYIPLFVITIILYWVIIEMLIENPVVGVLLMILIVMSFFLILKVEED